MRLQAPLGCTAISLGGREFFVDDGIVDVPDALAERLVESHGFMRAPPLPRAPRAPAKPLRKTRKV